MIAVMAAMAAAGAARAAPIVIDGRLDASYGAASSHVAVSPLLAAGAEGGFDLYLASDAGAVYAFLAADRGGTPFEPADPSVAAPLRAPGLDPTFGLGAPATIPAMQAPSPMAGVTAARDEDGDLELSIPISDSSSAFAAVSYASAQRLTRPAGFPLGTASQVGAAAETERSSAASEAAGAAPEPATWLTLILGVGLAGSMLRRAKAGLRGSLTAA